MSDETLRAREREYRQAPDNLGTVEAYDRELARANRPTLCHAELTRFAAAVDQLRYDRIRATVRAWFDRVHAPLQRYVDGWADDGE